MMPKTRSFSASHFSAGSLVSNLTNNNEIKISGKKCNPHQLFGVSSESPDHFKLKNTLISKQGYEYSLDQHPAANRYQYMSQKHFITLAHGAQFPTKKEKTKFLKKFDEVANNNKLAFHRRKGRLSDFVDKNSQMGNTYKIIGAERSEEGRQLRKCQRQNLLRNKNTRSMKIKSSKISNNLEEKSKQKYPTHKSMNQMLLAEKLKIQFPLQSAQQSTLNNHFNQKKSEQQNIRPSTMMLSRNSANSKSIFRLSNETFKPIYSTRQFEINLPEWNNNGFKINQLQWQKPLQQQWGRSTANSKMRSTISTRQFNRFRNE